MKKHTNDTKAKPVKVSPKRIGRLKSAQDVAKYIAKCIRRGEGGIDQNFMYKQVMMASMLLRAIEISSLEQRIEKLEDKMITQ
jgi:hypothetical protein